MKTLIGTALLLFTAAGSATAATLEASAGLGGVAKAGRWTLLRISINSAGETDPADIDVTWGSARLRRPVTLVSQGTRQYELYIRSSDATDAIDVRLVSAGRDQAAATARVRLLPPDEPVVVCPQAPDTAAADDSSCTVFVSVADLPLSPRGYEVADRVVWPSPGPAVSDGQLAAFRAWQSLEALDASGDLGLTPQVTRPMLARGLPAAVTPALAGVGATYVAGLLAVGLVLGLRGFGLASVGGALALVIAGTCVAIGQIGWRGSTSAVRLHHTSLLQQLPGTGASMLTIKGIAEFPAFDVFRLRFPVADGMLEASSQTAAAEQVIDEDGYPVIQGMFGLASRRSFTGEAFVAARVVDVEETGRVVRITNRSTGELHDCRFAAGLTPQRLATLAPGATASTEWSSADGPRARAAGGPLVTCALQDAPVPFTEPERPVVMHGTTSVVVYRRSLTEPGGAGARD